jgi:hypothetical protein
MEFQIDIERTIRKIVRIEADSLNSAIEMAENDRYSSIMYLNEDVKVAYDAFTPQTINIEVLNSYSDGEYTVKFEGFEFKVDRVGTVNGFNWEDDIPQFESIEQFWLGYIREIVYYLESKKFEVDISSLYLAIAKSRVLDHIKCD